MARSAKDFQYKLKHWFWLQLSILNFAVSFIQFFAVLSIFFRQTIERLIELILARMQGIMLTPYLHNNLKFIWIIIIPLDTMALPFVVFVFHFHFHSLIIPMPNLCQSLPASQVIYIYKFTLPFRPAIDDIIFLLLIQTIKKTFPTVIISFFP